MLKKITALVDSMRDAFAAVNNNSAIVVIDGDINQVINLLPKLVALGYRLEGGIQLTRNAPYSYLDKMDGNRLKKGKRDNGVATFINDELFNKVIL